MKKKIIGILAAAGLVLGLGLVVCSRMLPGEYVPAADEIALKIQFDTAEDVGLLVYDYQADGHEYSGGISNVDGSLIRRDSETIVVWDLSELAPRAEPFELSIQFRVLNRVCGTQLSERIPRGDHRIPGPDLVAGTLWKNVFDHPHR